ncbi:type I restriction enzyme HsdR N-terminal domain-containing protein [Tepidibacillus sp. HK-1]|uniref:type I restriction enzyme HsdR N-terminal domain-containing protein n=1 Tax=Tepidibacillus sp. HK-1 TaxID=1883407 RepID=UPI000852E926|nr:type I restriction enzyme HsdR N-terminal domain-containing protein [Tepidibacillus sp. HK-1]GBF12453.1 hypothetical protein HK1_02519 [Tepidibacillus sp. HK-1]
MRKYRPPLTADETAELHRLANLDFSNWSEADVREEYIVPLLKILGYRKELDYSVSREESYKLNPLFLQIGRDRIKLDYICSVRKQKFWIIESKPGGIKDNKVLPAITEEDIAQAHFYSLHPAIDAKFFVVTNGWYLNLYDRDHLNQDLDPILSILHTDLPEKFNQLDSYLGSSQLIFSLKNKLLKDIEVTLSSEVHLDRLDEFVDAVKSSVSKIRPNVLENFRANAKIQEKLRKQALEEFLYKEDLDLIVSSLFMSNLASGTLYRISQIVAKRFIESSPSRQYLFLNKLLLKELRAVTIPYYFHVLIFLLELKKLGMKNLPHFNTDIDEQILEWIEMCLFHFWKHPELRYLWAFEGLTSRAAIRLVYLSHTIRNAVNKITESQLFLFSEEEIAWLGPAEAKVIIDFVDQTVLQTLEKVVREFMPGGKIRNTIINQELLKLQEVVDKIEKATENDYSKLRQELGSSWSELRFYDSINHYWDPLSSGICDIISREKEIVNKLPERVKDRILLQEYLGNVNHANKCADLIDKKITISLNKEDIRSQYFDINTNPYSIRF